MKSSLALLVLALFSSSAFATQSLQVCRDGSAIRLMSDCNGGCGIRFYASAKDETTYSAGSLGALCGSAVAPLTDENGAQVGTARLIGSVLLLVVNGKQTACRASGSGLE